MKKTKPYLARGSSSNSSSRYLKYQVELNREPESFFEDFSERENVQTQFHKDKTKTLITRNQSPDIGFDRSINPYKGCEHGCIYCFARPTHAYLDLSSGVDFESQIYYKTGVTSLLEKELNNPNYVCRPIALGTNTDPYQPGEKDLRVTREILEFLVSRKHPVSIVTKGVLLERDLDLLQKLAAERLVNVNVSITTLSRKLKNQLEPRTASPQARLRLVKRLSKKGIPVGVLVAPIIPFINDEEIEQIVGQAVDAGAISCSGIMLRLPLEVGPLFEEWLSLHYPLKQARVMSAIRSIRAGKTNDARWFSRMHGEGPIADMIWKRFLGSLKKAGIAYNKMPDLASDKFKVADSNGSRQLSLI